MNDRTKSLITDTRNLAKEQFSAAWQLHMDRIQEVLSQRAPEEIERIFEERLAALANCMEEQNRNAIEVRLSEAAQIEEHQKKIWEVRLQEASHAAEQQRKALESRIEETVSQARLTAERDTARKLNQAVRRLRASENGNWTTELVQTTQGFCDRAAVFSLNAGALHLEAARGGTWSAQLEDVPLESAPAFASAVQSMDTVIAMRTKNELSARIGAWAGEADSWRSYIFPIASNDRVIGLLYADAGQHAVESSALELLTLTAGSFAGEHDAAAQKASLVNIAAPAPKGASVPWSSLNREHQDLHQRALRFARVQVAEIRLYKSENVKKGRAAHSLYASLKSEIDAAREAYRNDFLSASDSMVDYLHPELVRTLANDDVTLLGADYPGPLV